MWCIGCGEPEFGLCARCAASACELRFGVDGIAVRAAGDYGGVLRDAILAVKRGERACLEPLAALLAPLVPPGVVLVPVVTTPGRAAERGFDQAHELALRVARERGGTCADILRKRGAPQQGRARSERLHAGGRFRLRPRRDVPAVALLVDDVVTTGATLRDAAATLAAGGCRVAGAVVLARTPAGRETSGRAGRLVEA